MNLTVDRIIAESARVFNRRGYHGTTLDDIAQALGVTKAALYYYIKSKEDLLFQCHQRSIDIGIEAINEARASALSADERLRIALSRYIEGMTDQLNGTVALIEEGALSPRLYRRLVAQRDTYERQLREIISDGVAAGVFEPCNPKLVGFAILGAMNWLPKWYSPDGPCSGKVIAEAFATYLVRGLRASGAGPAPATDRV